MASIKERKDKDGKTTYYVQVRLKGYKPQCAAFQRITDAKKWIQDTESAIREGKHFKTSESKRHTLAEMIDRYIENVLPSKVGSIQKQTAQLGWWKEQIGHKLISDVTPSLIAEHRDNLLKGITCRGGPRSPSTVVRYMAALSHAFTIAVKEWAWVEDSPLRKVMKPKESRGRVRFLSEDERKRLLTVCKDSPHPFLYTAVVLGLSTGMRYSEQMTLHWSDVDLFKCRIILQKTKNGERRAIPIKGLALQLLKELEQKRHVVSTLLFPGRDPQFPAKLRSVWARAMLEASITDFRWHDLRHSTASYLAMNGASLAEIAEVLGHKTLAMVKRYAHLSESHTANVVANMNEKIFG